MSFILGRMSRRRLFQNQLSPKQKSNRKVFSTIEPLEIRRLLATFTVTTTSDSINAADGKLSLREAINQANATSGADTIVLKTGSYLTTIDGADEDANATGDFDITAPLTIKGTGEDKSIIDGGSLDRVFDVPTTARNGTSLTLQDLTVRAGVADNADGDAEGGGVLIEIPDGSNKPSNFTLTNAEITRCTADALGGAIMNQSGSVTLSGARISNSAADSGDLDDDQGITAAGGAIATLGGAVTVTNSTLTKNQGTDDSGGAIVTDSGSITLTSSTISNNTSGGQGGAIYTVSGKVTLSKTSITGNEADLDGGGIANEGGDIKISSSSTISGNTSDEGSGGGVWADDGDVTLDHSTITANTTGNGGGGIAAMSGNVIVTTGTITKNIASTQFADAGNAIPAGIDPVDPGDPGDPGDGDGGDGGGDDGGGDVNPGDDGAGGGGIFAPSGTVTVTSSTISSNNAGTEVGGGIFTQAGDVTIKSTTFTGNTAVAGGAIFASDGKLTLTSCTVSGNTGTDTEDVSDIHGGGVATLTGPIILTSTTITKNTGSGVATGSGAITLNSSTVSKNTDARGAGIDAPGGDVSLSKSTVSGNTATGSGGGIYVGEGTFTLTSSTVTGNASDDGDVGDDGFGGGSGIDAQGDVVTITASTISSNTGATGLAVGSGGLTITQSTISSNGSSNADSTGGAATGGGIYVEGGNVTITASLINSNTADDGAGVYLDSDILSAVITDTTIASNIATETGGGIFFAVESGQTATLQFDTIAFNKAASGAGIHNDADGDIQLQNTIVAKDSLFGSGGTGPDIDGDFDSLGHNLIGNGTDGNLLNGVNGDIVGGLSGAATVDPKLGSLASNGGPTKTLSLGSGSKAIDHGTSIAGITTDQRGYKRKAGSAPDIGAYESGSSKA